MNKREKLVIVGGGPVGLACALAMHHAKLVNVDISVIERTIYQQANDQNSALFDHRVYALSPASIAFLQTIGAWQHMPSERVSPIDAMRVYGDEGDKPTEINFRQGQALAHIIEHRCLMACLWRAIRAADIHVDEGHAVTAVASTHAGGNAYNITLASSVTIAANLVVGADGRASPLRSLVGIDVVEKDYQSDALVANFKTEKSHGNIAQQWFSKDGVLAYLPLPDKRISIVWSTSRANANNLRLLDDAAFAKAVTIAGQYSLGALMLDSARESIALKRIRAVETSRAGLVLLGDAAHAIHPLAGQGVNLGFGDVAALTETLVNKSALSRIGDAALLRRYVRQRTESAALMGETTDYLQSLFLRDDPVAKWLRGSGFKWFERLPLVKNVAADYAMQA
jgi:2-polyprenylphenol 6-hydroxylase